MRFEKIVSAISKEMTNPDGSSKTCTFRYTYGFVADITIDQLSHSIGQSVLATEDIIKRMIHSGLVERLELATGETCAFKLTYEGVHFDELQRELFFQNCFKWFSEHILELTALVLSIVSLLNTIWSK